VLGVTAPIPPPTAAPREFARIESALPSSIASPREDGRAGGGGGRWLLLIAVAVVIVAASGVGVAFAAGWLGGGGDTAAAESGTSQPAVTPMSSASSSSLPSTSPSPAVADDEVAAFLQEMESAMDVAGQGRHGIAEATTGYGSGDMTAYAAAELIQGVIDNRTEVLDRIAAIDVPADAEARRCHTAFHEAMTFSVRADERYLDWVYGSGTLAAAEPDNQKAGDWKRVFIRRYNALASDYGMAHDWSTQDI
jgi:hypothetical protein